MIEVIITAADQHIFTILNRQRYLAIAANLEVATALEKAQANRAVTVDHQRRDSVCGNMGTRVIASSEGVRIGPPAERE